MYMGILCIFCIFAVSKSFITDMVSIHIGNVIKEELRRQGRTNKWLAEQIHVNPRTVNKIFLKSVIDTQQLFVISKAMDYDFFKHYSKLI